ncbi:unnamed protein product [Brachionus calyciflorus]|uniref:non-specific serine/threonine protein kinase n=1 Tax=Brachionus calyciflorus TaxID=104777 RepID=A0A813X2E0_9BILA|nr:unnamed protein product [Brachionus calyciflorus]
MGCGCTKESVKIEGKNFYILSRIAEGGFGTIDLIEDSSNGNTYALKKIKCENKNEIEKASMENKYYKQLNNHQNIIKLIHDDIIEESKTQGYLVLSVFQFYRRGSLQEELEKNLKQNILIKPDRVVKLFEGISSGLNYIHELNLAHRDLKPHNVLLSDDGQIPVLTDFGSMTEKVIEITNSRKSQEIEDWASQNCSMFYRAPELFTPKQGEKIDEKADIWSLGCILYAIMYNKGPFDYVVEKGDSIALAVANANYTIPTTIKRDEILINIIKKTLQFDPFSRESIPKILNDLNKIQLFESNQNEEIV